jgi:methionyl-tRNA formyltransferase
MVWSARRSDRTQTSGAPGELLAVECDGVRVACGSGELVITEVGAPGVAPIAATEWFAQHGLSAGARFDSVDPAVARWALAGGRMPELVP